MGAVAVQVQEDKAGDTIPKQEIQYHTSVVVLGLGVSSRINFESLALRVKSLASAS